MPLNQERSKMKGLKDCHLYQNRERMLIEKKSHLSFNKGIELFFFSHKVLNQQSQVKERVWKTRQMRHFYSFHVIHTWQTYDITLATHITVASANWNTLSGLFLFL